MGERAAVVAVAVAVAAGVVVAVAVAVAVAAASKAHRSPYLVAVDHQRVNQLQAGEQVLQLWETGVCPSYTHRQEKTRKEKIKQGGGLTTYISQAHLFYTRIYTPYNNTSTNHMRHLRAAKCFL